MRSWMYDWAYRVGAPWDWIGVRQDLIKVLESGAVDPSRHPRSIDLGCGTGANAVYLAEQGFDSHGVDYSRVAIEKARQRAESSGVSVDFREADLTAGSLPGLPGPFDFIVDFGTLDDLRGVNRLSMANLITSITKPGSRFLEWCFYGETEELPRFSFKGTSQMSHIAPGELDELFGEAWTIETVSMNDEWRNACFLLTRH
jgi:SAM-dependent methyltransferase